MKLTLITVGKIKESFYRDAIQEFSKRLSRYGDLKIIEVPDEPTPENASPLQEEQILKKEGDRLLRAITSQKDPHTLVTVLAINGKALSSEEFSSFFSDQMTGCISHFIFVIGGSLGLSPEVTAISDRRLSFSKMTFPHQLMRVILLEQIYRAMRILHHEPYHK